MESLRAEQAALYDARDDGLITSVECQDKANVLQLLRGALYDEYSADTLPAVKWSET